MYMFTKRVHTPVHGRYYLVDTSSMPVPETSWYAIAGAASEALAHPGTRIEIVRDDGAVVFDTAVHGRLALQYLAGVM